LFDFRISNNPLTSAAQDAMFLSLPTAADDNLGYWNSYSNLGVPTSASAAKRAQMVAGGWQIIY
jgi:hypothetical protein